MSNIKDLFRRKKTSKLLSKATLNSVARDLESPDYIQANVKDKNRFVPEVDFTTASNFAVYGLAEKYYEDSINYITNEYPYDGSSKEKINWSLSGSYLDRYIFENEYPRTTGYVVMGYNYGSVTATGHGYDTPATQEYIYFKGGPTTGTLKPESLADTFKYANQISTSSFGLNNLEINGNKGITLEFWLNKKAWDSSAESRKQVIFDLWNRATFADAGYGRFRVELIGKPGTSDLEPYFNVELYSGSHAAGNGSGWSYSPSISETTLALSSSTSFTGSWNHFALTFANSGENMVGKLYRNGRLESSVLTGSAIGQITGSMRGYMGALASPVSGGIATSGSAKLSASLDEVRYWKTARSQTEIGQYWWTQVNGGTNTDVAYVSQSSTKYNFSNPVDLGVYYKFNEGITGYANLDSTVLDYAGRVTNGKWEGYSTSYPSRNEGSAIVESSASATEFKDPILYSLHPAVGAYKEDKKNQGKEHDINNNSSIYGTFPHWIRESDRDEQGTADLQKLTQIMASYFDTLQLQIQALPNLKNKGYTNVSASNKPLPFADRLLDNYGFITSDIFTKATDLEYFASRNDVKKFSEKLEETKNLIYENIYNNLTYIYKSKGTEKSLRNLIRCFGVGEELVKINLYADNNDFLLRDNVDYTVTRKKYVDFYHTDRVDATVFQTSSLPFTLDETGNNKSYITSNSRMENRGNTYELDVIFPKEYKIDKTYYVAAIRSGSLFGCHTSGSKIYKGDSNWGDPDNGNFQVYAVKNNIGSSHARFMLTSSVVHNIPELTSSVFKDVYSDSRWNFAVKVKPSRYPWTDGVSASATGTYDVEFSGYNYVLDVLRDSFKVSASISEAKGRSFLNSSKRFYVGSHRQDFTGTVLQQSNVRASSMRVWMDHLDDDTIRAHARDPTNFGVKNPYKNAYMTLSGTSYGGKWHEGGITPIPQMKTLALNWDFATLTSSNVNGQFLVPDAAKESTIKFREWTPGSLFNSQCITWENEVNLALSGCGRVNKNAGGNGWNSWANGAAIGSNDAATFRSLYDTTWLETTYAGLHTSEGSAGDHLSIAYCFYFDANSGNNVRIIESGADPTGGLTWTLNTTDYFRIVRGNFGEVFYQQSTDAGVTFNTIFTSSKKTLGNLYPVVTSYRSAATSGLTDATFEKGQGVPARWNWLGPIVEYHHPGIGYSFPTNATGSIKREHLNIAKAMLPETINSSDMVSVLTEAEDKIFTRETRPLEYYFAFEKSMYNVISEEIIKLFATIVDFNNLIGDPVNRYRQEYKQMEKLRSLYFERFQETPNLEKFVEFYKWIDSALSVMLQQLVPASSKFSENLRTMIESHVLERNKYWTKFPTLEMHSSDPEAGLRGINEMLYSWKRGHAPRPAQPNGSFSTSSNCEWWFERAERDNFNITSGDATVDSQRNTYRLANDFRSGSGPMLVSSRDSTNTTTTYEAHIYAVRNFTKTYRFSVKEMADIHGGSNFPRAKTVEYTHEALKFGSKDKLEIQPSSIPDKKDCDDVIIPNSKFKLEAKVTNTGELEGYTTGKSEIFAPFSLFSSSVTNGYIAEVASDFRTKTEINNYHDDIYGDDKGIPIQGPFTEAHVGGRQHRHVNINTASVDTTLTRAEAWNLDLSGTQSPGDPGILYDSNCINWQNHDNMANDTCGGIHKNSGGSGWNSWANADPILANDAVTFLSAFNDSVNMQVYAGLHTSGGAAGDQESIAYAFFFDADSANAVVIRESGADPTGGSTWTLNTTDYFRIIRGNNGKVFYQRSTDSGATYTTIYTSTVLAKGQLLYPVVTEYNTTSLGLSSATVENGHRLLIISQRTVNQPRATMIRDAYAKRPLNIANIKWGTGSAVAGNYREDYEMIQTSGRSLNNKFFVENEGFSPGLLSSPYVSGLVDFKLPDYDQTKIKNKYVFVEKFSAPGGPEVNSRGALNVYSEEYSPYNSLNFRNMIVRNSLNEWQKSYCGQFGVLSVSGTIEGYQQTRWQDYNTLANYHKVNRNAGLSDKIKNGYDREIEWVNSINITFSNYNRTLTKPMVFNYWDAAALSPQKLPKNGYIKIEAVSTDGWGLFGLSATSKHALGTTGEATANMKYAIYLRDVGADDPIYVYENGVFKYFENTIYAAGDQFRIVRNKNVVYYQYLLGSNTAWKTFYTSEQSGEGDLYPSVALYGVSTGVGGFEIANARISNPLYDNWFVQHPIPQSALQYAWINASYDKSVEQPFGYVSDFTVPSGNTSITASTISFTTASCWGLPVDVGTAYHNSNEIACTHKVNFSQYSFSASLGSERSEGQPEQYKYTITSSANLLKPGPAFLDNVSASVTINAHINNIHGTYGYPTWKQIRTAEHPIARYQRIHNTHSVIKPRNLDNQQVLDNPYGGGVRQSVNVPRPHKISYFIEPSLTFNVPLETEFNSQNQTDRVRLRHTYANNKCMFPIRGIGEQSLGTFLGIAATNDEPQIYDAIKLSDQWQNLSKLYNREIIYPREVNRTLLNSRTRASYAEVAKMTSDNKAVPSRGVNGIDKGPLERRTFWRDNPLNRNRRESASLPTETWDYGGAYSPVISGCLPNSQGQQDGYATSILGWGNTPITFLGVNGDAGEYTTNSDRLRNLDNYLTTPDLNQYPDCGELNSANFITIAGYTGDNLIASNNNKRIKQTFDWPTASAYYYHRPAHYESSPGSIGIYQNFQMRWRVAELSGKRPFFDSYEEYCDDIKRMAKDYSVIPEFIISDNMDYYIDGRYGKVNDRFLSLQGAANVTASAIARAADAPNRDFNNKFFREYSNTDFQKYFGQFQQDMHCKKITLKCNAVKKLLPYHGFYPAHRSLQLASMFSESLGPHISGIYWKNGELVPLAKSNLTQFSGALAVQSLLQPFFAPGIMYNTIKSGIAVDWAAISCSVGSSAKSRWGPDHAFTQGGSTGFITRSVNNGPGISETFDEEFGFINKADYVKRIPFEALIDPVGENAIPHSASDGTGILSLLYPSYYPFSGSSPDIVNAPGRFPYVAMTPEGRVGCGTSDKYRLYKLAMSNFLAEIPNFYLQNNKMKSIASLPQEVAKRARGGFRKDEIYYMDIYLEKAKNLVMIEDYLNGKNGNPSYVAAEPLRDGDAYRSFNGAYFGPPFQAGCTQSNTDEHQPCYRDSSMINYSWGPTVTASGDPAYAPYTPPYFYGRSSVTIAYTADEQDASGSFTYEKLFRNAKLIEHNEELEEMFLRLSGTAETSATGRDYPGSAANQASMPLSASLSMFRAFLPKETTFDNNGNVTQVTDKTVPGNIKWVIAPKMETPVLDFSKQPEEYPWGRGMWSGYGSLVSESNSIEFGIAQTDPAVVGQIKPLNSLLDKCFDTPVSERIGEIAEEKEIAEAIIAIPFCDTRYYDNAANAYAPTTKLMNKNFFKIRRTVYEEEYDAFLKLKQSGRITRVNASLSVSKMLYIMDQYVLPPELDFLSATRRVSRGYSDTATGQPSYRTVIPIHPFAMYIFEFKHKLKEKDLADIWQGVMPDISRTPEKSRPQEEQGTDNNVFSHPVGMKEFFHGKKLPENTRWMVFKVKKKANWNYYDMLASTNEDNRFTDQFTVGNVGKKFSYNWPYDFCSLVELAQLEVNSDFSNEPPPVPEPPEPDTTRTTTDEEQAYRTALGENN